VVERARRQLLDFLFLSPPSSLERDQPASDVASVLGRYSYSYHNSSNAKPAALGRIRPWPLRQGLSGGTHSQMHEYDLWQLLALLLLL
jgi:hypothetical protein